MALTLVTWNLKGSAGVDVAAVADHLRAVGADVVALQEVQRHQARALGRLLGATTVGWGFKHWPVVTRAEGMAVLGLSVPVAVRTRALSFRWRPWSFRRRIFQVASVPTGEGAALVLANVHLSTKREEARRAHEVATVLAAVGAATGSGPGPAAVVGDLNDRPGAPLFEQLAAAGLRDAWGERHPGAGEADGATNWSGWTPGTTDAPRRRLDYVLVSPAVEVLDVRVPRPGQPGFEAFALLSDHLPVTATLDIRRPLRA